MLHAVLLKEHYFVAEVTGFHVIKQRQYCVFTQPFPNRRFLNVEKGTIILSYDGLYLQILSLSEDKWSRNDNLVLERSKLPQMYEVMILSAVSFIKLNEIMQRSSLTKVGCTIASSYCRSCPEANCWISPELLHQVAWSFWSSVFLGPWGWLDELLKGPGQWRSLISRNGSPEGKKRKENDLQILTLTKAKPLTQKVFFWLFVWPHV